MTRLRASTTQEVERGAAVRTPAQMTAWGNRLSASGLLLASSTRKAEFQPVGLSNAVDCREILTPTTIYPWSTFARFSSNCTGTLTGLRLLVTAAHCINKLGTTTFYNITVTPASDGLIPPFDVQTAPFGTS